MITAQLKTSNLNICPGKFKRLSQNVYILSSKLITVIFKSKLATTLPGGSNSLICYRNGRKKHILFKFYFVEIWEKREIVTRNCSGAYRNKQYYGSISAV